MHPKKILLKNVRVHNLKNVTLSLPINQLIVFTGVSGSGKSSLAFDTIYLEGQRRYIESLSTFARRQLGEMAKPEADLIAGLSPTIAIEQKTAGKNPRSTVGTMTGIYDYMRVLFARMATPYCPISNTPLAAQSTHAIIEKILALPEGSKIYLFSPYCRGKKGEFKEEFADLMRKGFTRLRLDGELIDLSEEIFVDGKVSHDIDLVIDRLSIQKEEKSRLTEAVTHALEEGKGVFSVKNVETKEEVLYSTHGFSKESGISYEPLEPHDFSFNHPQGMCPSCQGLGEVEGKTCPSCKGARIKPYPAAARLKDATISSLTALPLQKCLTFFENLTLSSLEKIIAEELLKEIRERLLFLHNVGLHYLTLERTAPTLSGGEAQRVRLASQIGSGLVGATYVLDEPSIGLHPRDNHKLIGTLKQLRDKGNTVIVVEHDEEMIASADTIVDMGPLAGDRGGEVLIHGTLEEVMKEERSLTGAYLSGKKTIEIPKKRRPGNGLEVRLEDATHHNLKNVSVALPLGKLIAVTGVSGSGKSSLFSDVLYPALANLVNGSSLPVGAYKNIAGTEHLRKVIAIDQSPLGRTPRSNPATYTKLFGEIRDLFSQLPESSAFGFKAGRFSFNVKEGSCPHCTGIGMVLVDMDFREDAWVECSFCKGKRFDEKTLSILYRGKNIADILSMRIEEALTFFSTIPSIHAKLALLQEVGLGYLRLGQPSPTLSGGEAQRIKLAKELSRPSGGCFYLLDEPTTGLHVHDLHQLLHVLQRLVDRGNTVLVIEHNMDLVKVADWVIDLGPEGGDEGGKIIGVGTPEKIAKLSTPTGAALKRALFFTPFSSISSPPSSIEEEEGIFVEGAAQNNLKNISALVPREKIVLCTGPSGSGKTSFAFETLYAEGQRRYTETLSPYARQFIKQMSKPKVDRIEGILPSIAIEQKSHAGNPRSTIGTMTEVYDFLRLLYAHLGTAYCPESGEEITTISQDFVANTLLALPEGTRLYILSPLKKKPQETFETFQNALLSQGFLRIRLNNAYFALDEPIPFDPHKKNTLYLVIDRLIIKEDAHQVRPRLLEAIEKATEFSQGTLVAATEEKDLFFNLTFAAARTGISYPPLTPHTFSFNTEKGMCHDCQGLGFQYGVDISSSLELQYLSPYQLMTLFWKSCASKKALAFLSTTLGIDIHTPLAELTPEERHLFLWGAQEETPFAWRGIHPTLALLLKTSVYEIKEVLKPLLKENPCSSCSGTRLNPLARHVKVSGKTLGELCALPLEEAHAFLLMLPIPKNKAFLEDTKEELTKRLRFLTDIGLGYLSLDRSAPSLSGGETQRIRLARQLGSQLSGCLYVLDEPTIGLHPHNSHLLHRALRQLCALGNTLLLVEHDPMTITLADYLFDFGQGAGKEGGKIIAQGTLAEIKKNPASLTGAYLSGKKKIPYPAKRRTSTSSFTIKDASLHNLKKITVHFPLSAFSCITGVSGSGKSSLLQEILTAPHLPFEKTIFLSQNPLGHTSRADISTYVDLLTPLRFFFSSLPQAKAKGLRPKHFSFNHRKGMCPTCRGLGYKIIELQFLPPARVVCEGCKGYRLHPLSLQVYYKEKHLGNVLRMSVKEAKEWLLPIPKVARLLDTLISVGLGYVSLDQEIATLSGGEAQRLRLTRELARRSHGKTLYLFDEPTVGLHSEDLLKLLPIFHALVDKGNTLVVIEHNLDLIMNADYIVDLGPGAGKEGGNIVAQGSPEKLIKTKESLTGKYLKNLA